ncbi:MAG: lysophospholipid acyltransferase family protein [Bacteroidaceae bacterium]|nr:lysophospholipid acyltransferase family protein [Bacteroidaceae bacterium]
MAEKQQWAGTTYGSDRMHEYLIKSLRFIDVRLLYLFSAIFVIPVCLVLNPSRKTAYHYFRDILHYGKLKAMWATYVNHCLFAQVVIDKFAMYSGKRMNVETIGFEHYHERSLKEPGFVHLSSHIGNYEIAGYTLKSRDKRMNALVYAGEKESVMENRNKMFEGTNTRMIAVKSDMSHLFEIDSALVAGEVVSIPADRINGSPKAVECTFMGRKARFPQGPFSVATMRGLDVLAVNVMKEGWTKYKIYITPLEYDRTLPRKQQLQQLADAYVAELEKRLRQYPEQWYNFFEFWN